MADRFPVRLSESDLKCKQIIQIVNKLSNSIIAKDSDLSVSC